MKVFLARNWDEKYREFYYPIKGNIIPSLNGNMKSDSVCAIFKGHNIAITSAKQARMSADSIRKAKNLESYIRTSTISNDQIRVKTNLGSINLDCEELTKFLESFTLFPSGIIK